MVWRPDLERIMRSEAETIAAVGHAMCNQHGLARVEELGGARLVALGPGRYVNRAVGIGPTIDEGEIDEVERFFETCGLDPSLQVTSLADEDTLARLARRGFRAEWFRWVMVGKISKTHADAAGAATISEVGEEQMRDWTDVLAAGNDLSAPEQRAISDEYAHAAHEVPGSIDFLAAIDGTPAACGSIEFADGIAWLGGASTIPEFRGRGLQRQLLGHRIRVARRLRSDLVAATTIPGSVSARNLVRMGLSLVDVQTVMTRR